MRAVVTRVSRAEVCCSGTVTGSIEKGFLVLLGVGLDDTEEQALWTADRIAGLRVFEDDAGKMNLSLGQVSGEILVVSNFTLYADLSSRRPGFTRAARPEQAEPLYRFVIEELRRRGFQVAEGVFGGDMDVSSINDGPVTLILDAEKKI